MKRFAKWILLIAALVLISIYFSAKKKTQEPENPPFPQPVAVTPEVVQNKLTIIENSEFDQEFYKPGGNQKNDLRLLADVLMNARILVKDHHTLVFADNRDFTKFISGNNKHSVAWIRPDHPSINRHGEITDRQGNPLFFHQESSSYTILRSAGNDGIMWNEDDIIFDPKQPE
ncbi:hypothetical protein NT6N_17870 [Oceaniferula spumae]|uniref:Uncharacterized protein n=1 Tax=Oceaniferula spumae TaxID=2979115 RepID=A0AAT9FLC0_9BACT